MVFNMLHSSFMLCPNSGKFSLIGSFGNVMLQCTRYFCFTSRLDTSHRCVCFGYQMDLYFAWIFNVEALVGLWATVFLVSVYLYTSACCSFGVSLLLSYCHKWDDFSPHFTVVVILLHMHCRRNPSSSNILHSW